MSYCRWSSDDFQCDVYVWEDVGGYWAVAVAGRRPVFDKPLPPPVADDDVEACLKRHRIVMDMLENDAEYTRIGLPHDDAFFTEDTPGDAAARLRELKRVGYNVPQYAIDELEKEQAEVIET